MLGRQAVLSLERGYEMAVPVLRRNGDVVPRELFGEVGWPFSELSASHRKYKHVIIVS